MSFQTFVDLLYLFFYLFSLARQQYLHSASFQSLAIFHPFEYSTTVTRNTLQKAGKSQI